MLAFALPLALAASTLLDAHKEAGFDILVPDQTARGYALTRTEIGEMAGKKVVHLTYTNLKAFNSFELLEYPASGVVGSGYGKILEAKTFDISTMEDDTVVSIRKGKTDVTLIGSLMSAPSAKKMLERVVPYHP